MRQHERPETLKAAGTVVGILAVAGFVLYADPGFVDLTRFAEKLWPLFVVSFIFCGIVVLPAAALFSRWRRRDLPSATNPTPRSARTLPRKSPP
jgi:hypothetical protein